MAFGDDLLASLAATRVKPSESPFGMAASTLSSLSPGLSNPYASVGSNIGISVGSSLLAALLSGVAKNQADKENAAFAPVLNNFLAADPTTRATMAAREPKFQSLANLLTAQELTRKADVQDAVAKEGALLPMRQDNSVFEANLDLLKEKTKREMFGSPNILGVGSPDLISGLPQGLQNKAYEEAQTQANKLASFDFIDRKFEEAKNLTGGKSALTSMVGVPTTEGNALKGIQDSLVFQLDKTLGREINSDVRARLLSLTPQWYDDPKTIDVKKEMMKQAIRSLTPGTPILNALGSQGNQASTQLEEPVTNEAYTLETLPDGRQVYIKN